MRTFLINSFLTFLFLSALLIAQEIKVHNFIGKSQSDVIKKYGNPVHKDLSDPSMVCMFYKSGLNSMIFVSNREGVYQAEASASYENEKTVKAEIDKFISSSLSDGFNVDTVSVSDFHLTKKGVKVDLQYYENKLSKKYDIKVKANKTG